MGRNLLHTDVAVVALIQMFIDRCRGLTNQAELHALLEDMARELGFLYFALINHLDLRRKEPWIININNYPSLWVEYFIANALWLIDPVIKTCGRTNAPFLWPDMHRYIYVSTEGRDVMTRGANAGVANGFTVPVCVPGEYSGSCSFATPRRGTVKPADMIAGQFLASFAIEAARRLALDIPPLIAPRLSRRQRQCAVLAGRGLKAAAIGYEMGLAPKTVSNYLDGARRRFHVHSSEQLLVHALLGGEISLIELDTRQ